MKREWKPGDVAMVLLAVEWHRAMRTGLPGNMGWELASPTSKRWCADGALDLRDDEIRPLAVIDPESREQVERLLIAYYGVQPSEYRVEKMQAALREYRDPKPPKPEEPTGRYAVVVDDEGREWLRTGWDYGMDKPWQCEATHAHWQTVGAVRVLSGGVTA